MAEVADIERGEDSSTVQDGPDVPAIYQCAECAVILGDSTACVWASESMDVIALENVNPSAVSVVGEVYTSTEGIDQGSTYMTTRCKICKTTLGSYYMATTRAVDHLREKYTFDGSSVKRYVLGTFGGKSSSDTSILSSNDGHLQLRKVQGITVFLEERLKRVENILKIERTAEEETQYNELSSTFIQTDNTLQGENTGKRKAEKETSDKRKRNKP